MVSDRGNNVLWELEASLTKDYNRVAVNVRNVLDHEIDATRDQLFRELRTAWSMLPKSDNRKETKVVPKVEYQQQQQQRETKVGNVTNDDIKRMTKFAKGGQLNILRQGLNNGVFTEQELRGISRWDETQSFIDATFKANAYDKTKN